MNASLTVKQAIPPIFVLFLTGTLIGVCPAVRASDEDLIRPRMAVFEAGMNQKDAGRIMSLFSPASSGSGYVKECVEEVFGHYSTIRLSLKSLEVVREEPYLHSSAVYSFQGDAVSRDIHVDFMWKPAPSGGQWLICGMNLPDLSPQPPVSSPFGVAGIPPADVSSTNPKIFPLTGWLAHATGESTASNDGGVLAVDAMKSGGAWFTLPRPYGLDADYSVEFDFQLREANGHWLTLYSDGMIYLSMDWGTSLVHHQPGMSWEQTGSLARFDLNRWYSIKLDASPARGTVDIWIDGEKAGSATGLKPVLAWHTLSPHTKDPNMIFVGNADAPGDVNAEGTYNCGRGSWRNFKVKTASLRAD